MAIDSTALATMLRARLELGLRLRNRLTYVPTLKETKLDATEKVVAGRSN